MNAARLQALRALASDAIETAAARVASPTVADPMISSAELALDDARWLLRNERAWDAAGRALASLGYTVGRLHPDYARVLAAATALRCPVQS